MNPQPYYLTNIIIHILNTILVFFLIAGFCIRLKLSENSKLFITTFTALLFGIHPMHVESVSWIAERKDVLYAFFYLCGLLTYLRYTDTLKGKWYWATFLLFIASCLSKPMAVVFPMSLLCIDFLLQRKLNVKLIIEKAVFFLASLICGSAAFYTQNKTGAIADFGVLTVGERIMYAAYGYIMYMAKLFNPTYLSTFYPYPYRYITGELPGIYYAAPFIAIAVPAAILYMAYKKGSTCFRVAGFGLAFFTANVLFVLQFVSVGAAIMADRYSYVAYIGLIFMITYFIEQIRVRMPAVKMAVTCLLFVVCGALAYLCYERTYAWHDSKTLLTDAIEKYPYRALLSYKWLGNYYAQQGEADSALANYELLAKLHAADAKVYRHIGEMYSLKKDYAKANEAFEMSAQMGGPVSTPQTGAPQNISNTAMATTTQKLDASVEKKVAEKGFEFLQSKQYAQALEQYNVLIQINPNNAYYHFYRGAVLFSTNDLPRAIDDWQAAAKTDIKDLRQSAAYNLSVAYDSLNKDSLAVYYMEQAQALGYHANTDFVTKLRMKKKSQRK